SRRLSSASGSTAQNFGFLPAPTASRSWSPTKAPACSPLPWRRSRSSNSRQWRAGAAVHERQRSGRESPAGSAVLSATLTPCDRRDLPDREAADRHERRIVAAGGGSAPPA